MNSRYLLICIVTLVMVVQVAFSQQETVDRGIFKEYKNEFFDSIKAESNRFAEEPEEPDLRFKMDFSGKYVPTSTEDFTTYWHNDPISQGWSGMCWCFATTSCLESEVYRLSGRKMKFSELYTVYWEYVEKARRFVKERGDSEFGQGSEANAVIRIWKKYGVVPAEAYTGLKPGQKFHDHREMFKEMKSYLHSIKKDNAWNEDAVLATIKSILNHHIGKPPVTINSNGKQITPLEYLEDVVRLNPDDYIDFMSLMEKPYYQQVEYDVPDNWWNSAEYYNVPLEDFMKLLKSAIRDGYTASIGGDVSEPGYDAHNDAAMVPSFDIPADYIDENARQFRFSNNSTTDDHAIHVVGFLEKDGKDWFLIKDSGSGSRNGDHEGYYFYHEDYVKLKMMNVMVHKEAAQNLLKKMSN